MKKVVITGANGFIGWELTNQLLKKGVFVYGVGVGMKGQAQYENLENFCPIEARFEDYQSLDQVIQDRDIDVFYHFAWAGGFEQSSLKDYHLQLQNASYAGDAIQTAVKIGAKKFVYAQTNNTFETEQFIASFDDFTPRGTCIYASAKTAAELICRTVAAEKGIEYNSGIIPMIYGEGNRSKQLMNVVMVALACGKTPKLIEGNNQYDIVSVKDVARAFEAIGEKGVSGRRYWVGHRELKTFREWMIELRDAIAPGAELGFGEYADPLDIDYSGFDLPKLYNDTGYECQVDFKEGILNNLAWLKSSGSMDQFV